MGDVPDFSAAIEHSTEYKRRIEIAIPTIVDPKQRNEATYYTAFMFYIDSARLHQEQRNAAGVKECLEKACKNYEEIVAPLSLDEKTKADYAEQHRRVKSWASRL